MQHFRCLIDTEPAEVTQLDDLTLARIQFGKCGQRLIERQQLHSARSRAEQGLIERHPYCVATALLIPRLPLVIDQNPADDLRAQGKEMSAIFARDAA
jgi:hypothetical protein